MDLTIIATYCLCDDLLIAMNHRQEKQAKMSDAEVMTTALVASLYFGGNYQLARQLLHEQNYIPKMLSKSRFSRRLHRIKPMFLTLFGVLSEAFKAENSENIYAIDTVPIAVCFHFRIPRAKLYQEEVYRGYKASKKRYFYGLKIHLLVTATGQPVEFFLTPGSWGDISGLPFFDFDLPQGSRIFADKAYNNYEIEDILEDANLHLQPIRKVNSLRPHPHFRVYLAQYYRKRVETAFSLIERLLPHCIHATTDVGFELKVVLFVLASAINSL